MPDLKLNVNLSITGGPSWVVEHRETVDAYDIIDVVVPPDTTDMVVEIQPGAAARVGLFAIQSSLYGPEIQFKTSDGADDSAAVALLGPQIHGRGVASLFAVAPLSLKLTNTHAAADNTKRARIQILVARDATP